MAHWKAWRIWRECGRKRRYAHEGQARRRAHKVGQRAYRCSHCDGFHLTSQDASSTDQPYLK